MLKIAVLVSGGGTNLQSIIDSIEDGNLKNCKIETIIASKENIYSLERAKKHGIRSHVISRKEYGDKQSDKILEILDNKVDLIVLAGYLSILSGNILDKFSNRIINIHPSLIPSFCGSNMYGLKVHEAVINKGVKYSGATVHFVNNEVDGGAIIIQEVVKVDFMDNAESLQKKVLEKEHIILPEAIRVIAEGKVKIINGKVKIEE